MRECELAVPDKDHNWEKATYLSDNGPWKKNGVKGDFYIHWCITHQQFSIQCGYDRLVSIISQIADEIEKKEKDNKIKDLIEGYFGSIEDRTYWGKK